MNITRRRFLGVAVYAGTGAVAASFLDPSLLFAAPEQATGLGRYATGEQMAATPATFYRAYRSKPTTSPHITTWLQIDLGKSQAIDAVKLYPACERMYPLLDEYYGGQNNCRFFWRRLSRPKRKHHTVFCCWRNRTLCASDGDRNAAGENVAALGFITEK